MYIINTIRVPPQVYLFVFFATAAGYLTTGHRLFNLASFTPCTDQEWNRPVITPINCGGNGHIGHTLVLVSVAQFYQYQAGTE
jgi:hypothetical protein